ncbi:MAG TPA: TIR domain-containing protein [Chthoniobacterales bacterium]|nr:TIR domain-containing protein [Chthoniobacterales bacterium]
MKYWAFLSYSHTDRQWGDWLHKALETYRVPSRLVGKESRDGNIPARVFPVFRDREELPVSADLNSNIDEALRESRYLIVICSPRSAQSRWVGEEIRTFKKLGREDRILALIVDGEPNASDGKEGYKPEDECFHEALRFRWSENGEASAIRSEPIAADAREDKDGRNNAKLKLLAGLLGVNYDDLKQRDNERRIRRLRFIVAAALLLVSGFGALSVYAWWQKKAAQQAQTRAESEKSRAESERIRAESALARTQAALSQSDFLQATRSLEAGRVPDALAQLSRSLSFNPRNEAALFRLVTLLNYRNFAAPLKTLKNEGPVQEAKVPADPTISGSAQSILGKNAPTLNAEKEAPAVHPMYQKDPDSVHLFSLSPDARRLSVFSDFHIAQIWDARTGDRIKPPFKYGDRGQSDITFLSPDGKRAVNVGGGPMRLWDVQSGNSVANLTETADEVAAAEFSSDGRQLATAQGELLSIWDGSSGKLLLGPLQHDSAISMLRFSPDAARIAAVVRNAVVVWDTRTGARGGTPLAHESQIVAVRFSPDGRLIATATGNNSVQIWNANDGKPVTAPIPQTGQENDMLEFSADRKRLVVGSPKTISIWDAQNGKQLLAPFAASGSISSVQFDPVGRRVVTASSDRTARIWDADTGASLCQPMLHPTEVRWAGFSDDGGKLITLLADVTGTLWDVGQGAALPTSLKRDGRAMAAEFTRDGNEIIIATQNPTGETSVEVFSAATGKPRLNPKSYGTIEGLPEFSPDAKRLVTKSEKSAQVWDMARGRPVGPPLTHDSFVMSAHFNSDGTRVVTASQDNTVKIWNAEDGQLIGKPLVHEDKLMWAAFSPDSRRIATSAEDKHIRIWDAATGAVISDWEYVTYIASGEFSPDGRRLLTRTMDDVTARIWDVEHGEAVGAPLRHTAEVTFAEFSPDGTKIVTASDDHTARLWDASTGKPLTDPLQHPAEVMSARFSPNGRQIVTTCIDKAVRIWDVESGKLIAEPFPGGDDQSAQFSPDGKRLLIAWQDGGVFSWDLLPSERAAPGWLLSLAEMVAGQRLDDHGVFQVIRTDPSQTRDEIENELAKNGGDEWSAFGKWWLGDRKARTISPFSQISVAEYNQSKP